ncbi:MAG: DUF3078 domain-containing protein [Prevotella sp.]|nr:DUF3078 domain-containing protein [Prevotella sp.]
MKRIVFISAMLVGVAAFALPVAAFALPSNEVILPSSNLASNEPYLTADSITLNSPSPSPRHMRLFLPPAFHTDLARQCFSLEGKDDLAAERALLAVCIRRPDLVRGVRRDVPLEKPLPAAVPPPLDEAFDFPSLPERDFEPVELYVKKPDFWTFKGDFYLSAVQNYYSGNWYQGLESNFAWLAKITLEANYDNKQKFTFDNKLEMNLGFQTDRSDEAHKVKTSEDLLRYTGMLGIQATKRWYYTLQVIAATQFMRTFDTNSSEVLSAFASPLDVNASVGMSYKFSLAKERLTGSVYVSPAALGFKYVDRRTLAEANGITPGRHSSADFGYTFTIEGTWNFNDYISWQTRLYGYSPYDRVELQWENTLTVKVSKIIAVSVYAYPRFDDSPGLVRDPSYGYFQLKEYTSFGLTYSL